MMRFLKVAVVVVLATTAGSAWAQDEITQEKQAVLTCINDMLDELATWGQCVELMFAPCAQHEVGREVHVSCLTAEREAWRDTMAAEQVALAAALVPAGAMEFGQLMEQWMGFVGPKCEDMARDKAGFSADAAYLGCEISEIAGATAEMSGCRAGLSTAPYCVLRE